MSRSRKCQRTKKLTIRYTEEEYADLQRQFARTTATHLATYFRKVSLAEPVVIKTRNASFDEFLATVIPLQRELRALRRLHEFTPENETQLVELHRAIQLALEKITLPCMPS